jgi:hypothetical protein
MNGNAGPHKTDRSVSMLWANVVSILVIIPVFLIAVPLYGAVWGSEDLGQGFESFLQAPAIFVVFFLGIVIHEWLHGLAWRLFGDVPASAVQYGFKWKTLTPYAHATQPMSVRPYQIGTLMPGLLLGLLPLALGLLLGNGWLYAFGILFTWAASGDFLILWLLRGARPGSLVEDHPSRAGCYLIEAPEPSGT